ncbi:MAG: glycosyltransferase [Chloroflexi bacterium]|nr:glycosyltransferase [Chloroflexota bacterium]
MDLISFASEDVTDEHLAALRRFCRRVNVAPYRPFQPSGAKALLGYFSLKPRSIVDTHDAELQQLVAQAGRERSYDAVIASQLDMAQYALALPEATRIFEEVELTTLYERFAKQERLSKKLSGGLTYWKTSNYVADLLKGFAGCTVVSEPERERVRRASPFYAPIKVVPNGVDIVAYSGNFGPPEPDTLVYSGALTYDANFDAVDFFLREVFPIIQARRSKVKLSVTGKLDGVPVDRLPLNSGVTFTGYLDDIRPRVARSWVNVVPLRVGGGTRLKILESLALGTPVVATRKGVEGLDLVSGRDILIADTPSEFSKAVLSLLDDPALRETLSRNGRRAVAAKYDWQIVGQMLNEFVERLTAKPNPPRREAENHEHYQHQTN